MAGQVLGKDEMDSSSLSPGTKLTQDAVSTNAGVTDRRDGRFETNLSGRSSVWLECRFWKPEAHMGNAGSNPAGLTNLF